MERKIEKSLSMWIIVENGYLRQQKNDVALKSLVYRNKQNWFIKQKLDLYEALNFLHEGIEQKLKMQRTLTSQIYITNI